MSETIERKCIEKGVKLTEQRRVIARVISHYIMPSSIRRKAMEKRKCQLGILRAKVALA